MQCCESRNISEATDSALHNTDKLPAIMAVQGDCERVQIYG